MFYLNQTSILALKSFYKEKGQSHLLDTLNLWVQQWGIHESTLNISFLTKLMLRYLVFLSCTCEVTIWVFICILVSFFYCEILREKTINLFKQLTFLNNGCVSDLRKCDWISILFKEFKIRTNSKKLSHK